MQVLKNEQGEFGRFDRRTKGGRRLWYQLQVIQQPERARACGSGSKSSSDRRPVDPPPVIELHVWEGETWECKKDITFNYNANFFLFTTLAHARNMAHGRVQTPAATPPVLSGMPCSGMAYLDRPNEAGFFIFPDLSVRHEGLYYLKFALYEQTKDECDQDEIPPDADSVSPCGNFFFRMAVKSNNFTVYSAKKFPGLAQSTLLSRICAEQGCRVRIRRDVRMRRREAKPGADSYNDEEGQARRRRTQTPESAARARSMSNHSVERTPFGGPDMHRRPSHASDYPGQPLSGGPRPAGYMPYANPHDQQYQQFAPPPPPLPPAPVKQSSSVPASPSYPNYPTTPMSNYHQPTHPSFYRERPLSQEFRPNPYGSDYRQPSDGEYRRLSMETPQSVGYMTGDRRQTIPNIMDIDISQARLTRPHSDSTGSNYTDRPLWPIQLPKPQPETSQIPQPSSRGLKIKEIVNHETHRPVVVAPDRADQYQAELRGKKRQRDERDPGRIVNGARQPEDLAKQDRLPFYRANGVLDAVECQEQL